MKNDLKRDAPLVLKLSEKQHTRIKKMNAKIWDHYIYHIADYYCQPLLTEMQPCFLTQSGRNWTSSSSSPKNLAKEDGFTVGHWAVQDNENYGMCEVSDKFGNLAEVWLMVYRDA